MSGHTAATKLAVAIIGASVITALAKQYGGGFGLHFLLTPAYVLGRLELWQPFTYSLIADDPLSVIFGAMIVWSIGGALEQSWGSKRMLSFSFGVTITAGILTVLLGLLFARVGLSTYSGARVITGSLWVAYGLSYGSRQTNFWGMPVSGNVFALIGAGFVLLSGIFAGPVVVVPELIGLGLTFLFVRGYSPSLLWTRFTSWRLRHQLKSRSKHLKVIGRDRNMGSGSDDYLH